MQAISNDPQKLFERNAFSLMHGEGVIRWFQFDTRPLPSRPEMQLRLQTQGLGIAR
jgi:hypothetical protein